jgi:hypothetical protein
MNTLVIENCRLRKLVMDLRIENTILENRLKRKTDLNFYKTVEENKEEKILRVSRKDVFIETVFAFCLGFSFSYIFFNFVF